MALIYVNIGSNLGNREYLIQKAIECIADKYGIICQSGVIESEPWGFDSSHRFLNIGISFRTDSEPENILKELKHIEKTISDKNHRDENGNYSDRFIDIDIMAIDNLCYFSENLEIPHRHLSKRNFFLLPLRDLAPDWRHPSSGESITEMLLKINA